VRPNEVVLGFNTESPFGEKCGENQTKEKILELLRQNPKINAKTIAAEINLIPCRVEKADHHKPSCFGAYYHCTNLHKKKWLCSV
jgi:hypothetical protein